MRLEVAHRVRAHQEPVLVELDRRRVVVVVQAHLRRVAGEDEVLAVVVGEEQVLAAVVERVQAGVGVLLPLAEVRQVELVAIRVPGAEEPDAPVDVGEEEAAEVGVERLGAGADRDEVVIGPEVGQLVLDERLLEGPDFSGARSVPWSTFGLVCASSLNEKLLTPRVGASLIRQSTGLNAASPWNRSNESEKKSSVKKLLGRPKKFPENGRSVLSNARGLRSGSARPSKSRLAVARDVEERVLAEDRDNRP